MSIEKGFIAILAANAGVTAAFGTRVYTDLMPEGSLMPTAVITLVDSVPIQGIRQETVWRRARVQVDVYGVAKRSVIESAEAIKNALRRYQGSIADLVIDDVMLVAERSDYSVEGDIRIVSLDFMTYYEE